MATTPLPRRPALIGDEKLETEAMVFNYHFKTCLRKSLGGGGGGGGGSVEQRVPPLRGATGEKWRTLVNTRSIF